MHLNEFADPKIYTLSAGDMASILKQLERVWCDNRLGDYGPFICGPDEAAKWQAKETDGQVPT